MQDVKELKKAICDIGKRIYKRGFAAANDGNISVRLNDTEVLCTPTMHCKGFLKPKDICLVDMEGNQLGGKKFAETILPFVRQSNVIILANHGTVSYGESIERAYWWTEVLDAYCRILILARQLGPIQYLSPQHTQELLDLKAKWGFTDPRLEQGFGGDIRCNATFRHTWSTCGVEPRAFSEPNANGDA